MSIYNPPRVSGAARTMGTATLNFGSISSPTSSASVGVTGQGNITSDSCVEVWVNYKATADHGLDEIREFIPLQMNTNNMVVGVGFTIEGKVCYGKTYGDFSICWAWT